ncbi:methyltransferase domain-containing protein [Paenibacillus mendelii]|uniref:Methyltransferase domain-containing protein n=1 Tax=Paenibacillus mendelii TaxID=206163 RepID=A0ABV6J5P2_9BACL|nr:methyltransferase domain-containing protein [Paenibacillus mendelii]MCQ6560200.1 methyltransferase domain-containing protein [Paenibacillus mendelii]
MNRLMKKELLDGIEGADGIDSAELETSLREVWQVNRYLGGNPALFVHLKRMILEIRQDRPIRILDVATGLADIPLALVRWAERRKLQITVTGIDIHPRIAQLAADRTKAAGVIRIDTGDGRQLPYEDGSFDIVFSNLALHHMDEDGAVRMLQEMRRVARIGWVVTDLQRHPAAYGAAKLLARFVWRSPVTRHDGPLSVLRSFTVKEADDLLVRAGLHAEVRKHFPFRLALVGRA